MRLLELPDDVEERIVEVIWTTPGPAPPVDLVDRQAVAGDGGNRARGARSMLLDDRRRGSVEGADRRRTAEGDTATEHRGGREEHEGPRGGLRRGGSSAEACEGLGGGVRAGSAGGTGSALSASWRFPYTSVIRAAS